MGLIGGIGFASWWGYRTWVQSTPHSPPPFSKVVETETVTLQDLSQTVRLLGTIHPRHTAVFVTKTSGTLAIFFRAGQKVSKGTLIAQVENPDLTQRYALSQSSEKITKIQYERILSLAKSGHASQQTLEEKKNAWIESQKALANAKIELERTQFIAPFDGVIGVFKAREGSQIREGDPIVTVFDPSSLVVEFGIPPAHLSTVHDGQPVQIGDQSYSLTHVQKMIDEETHMAPANVEIANPPASFLMGETIDVEVTLHSKKGIIVVPFEAIFLKNGQSSVYRVEEGKTVVSPVKLGIRQHDRIEITDGLKVGQKVVIRGLERLYPGLAVKIA
jgi:membrane fusion protein (multidrug efflux system)